MSFKLAPVLAGAVLTLASTSVASAQVVVSDAWIAAPPVGAPTAAGYLTLRNTGKRPERLLGGTTPVAAGLGVHSMSMAGGVMRMRALTAGLEIAPGATVRLQPGGDHLMLTGLRRPLKAGDRVPVTLKLSSGEQRQTLPVKPR